MVKSTRLFLLCLLLYSSIRPELGQESTQFTPLIEQLYHKNYLKNGSDFSEHTSSILSYLKKTSTKIMHRFDRDITSVILQNDPLLVCSLGQIICDIYYQQIRKEVEEKYQRIIFQETEKAIKAHKADLQTIVNKLEDLKNMVLDLETIFEKEKEHGRSRTILVGAAGISTVVAPPLGGCCWGLYVIWEKFKRK